MFCDFGVLSNHTAGIYLSDFKSLGFVIRSCNIFCKCGSSLKIK